VLRHNAKGGLWFGTEQKETWIKAPMFLVLHGQIFLLTQLNKTMEKTNRDSILMWSQTVGSRFWLILCGIIRYHLVKKKKQCKSGTNDSYELILFNDPVMCWPFDSVRESFRAVTKFSIDWTSIFICLFSL